MSDYPTRKAARPHDLTPSGLRVRWSDRRDADAKLHHELAQIATLSGKPATLEIYQTVFRKWCDLPFADIEKRVRPASHGDWRVAIGTARERLIASMATSPTPQSIRWRISRREEWQLRSRHVAAVRLAMCDAQDDHLTVFETGYPTGQDLLATVRRALADLVVDESVIMAVVDGIESGRMTLRALDRIKARLRAVIHVAALCLRTCGVITSGSSPTFSTTVAKDFRTDFIGRPRNSMTWSVCAASRAAIRSSATSSSIGTRAAFFKCSASLGLSIMPPRQKATTSGSAGAS